MEMLVKGPATGFPKKLITNDTTQRTLIGVKFSDFGLNLGVEDASEENAIADRLWANFLLDAADDRDATEDPLLERLIRFKSRAGPPPTAEELWSIVPAQI